MMVSTKGRYALRVMLDLCQHAGDGFVSLKTVSQRQDISMKYLEAIVATLQKGGLLESRRGKEGGYRLTRKTEEYTVGDVVKLTEGSIAPVACLESCINTCERSPSCPTLPMWIKLEGIVSEYLDGVTLKDLLENTI